MSEGLDAFRRIDRIADLERINADLQRKLKAAKAKTEDQVAAVFAGSRDAMLTIVLHGGKLILHTGCFHGMLAEFL